MPFGVYFVTHTHGAASGRFACWVVTGTTASGVIASDTANPSWADAEVQGHAGCGHLAGAGINQSGQAAQSAEWSGYCVDGCAAHQGALGA